MSENSDALKRGYDAFNSGDADTVAELYSDDVVWEGPNTEGVPMSGKNEGKDAVMQALGQIGEMFESFNVSADELVEEGDTIVVLSNITAKTKAGNEIKSPGVEIWRFGGDGKVNRVQSLGDTAEMKEALG
ncbi:MAG TPA: nuclear transport factor 2 family protein [Thermoleophilaceae bacterium]|nr:nuclear transport factor 2 family protein [Thermoleophilaceae bacterium]